MPFVLFKTKDRALSGVTITSQSGPGSNGNKGVLCIPQSFSLSGTSPSDCLMPYPGQSLGGSYPSAELLTAFSTAPTDWASKQPVVFCFLFFCGNIISFKNKHIIIHLSEVLVSLS